jgi:hypothetical protein
MMFKKISYIKLFNEKTNTVIEFSAGGRFLNDEEMQEVDDLIKSKNLHIVKFKGVI